MTEKTPEEPQKNSKRAPFQSQSTSCACFIQFKIDPVKFCITILFDCSIVDDHLLFAKL